MTTQHNVNIQQLHARIMLRLSRAPRAIHPLTPEEAFFMARMIEYVDQSTALIQSVIDIIEADTQTPSNEIQRAHALLVSFRGVSKP